MANAILYPLILAFFLLWGSAAASYPEPVEATLPQPHAIGFSAAYWRENAAGLTLEDAVAAQGRGEFTASGSRILNFGIGARPVWIHFSVDNPTDGPLPRRLSIETAWLDKIDIHFRHRGRTVAAFQAGDTQAHGQRPVDGRFFAFEHDFPPGVSDVFIRVETPDPMVVPVHLMSEAEARAREERQGYGYGFLYGFLFALLAYNATLDAGLRNSRYILYSLFLGMFMLMNISYTGHGFKWLWPDQLAWVQWSNPILMMLYGTSGLMFALRFLDIRQHFPRIHKGVIGYIAVFAGLLATAILMDHRAHALQVSFSFAFLYACVMLALGGVSLRSGRKPARYFLLAAIAGSVGAGVTALSVWGFIPYSVWTFRAVEVGMLIDATLLALALVYQFRVGQEERLRAEQLAQLDPLTGINNRRAFYDRANAIWNMTLRHNRHLSVIVLDIDHFKRINDVYGHALGDQVLVETARLLMRSVRREDVAARWGGEEFLLLMPETDLREAVAMAERLRAEMAGIRLKHADGELTFTASLGVVQMGPEHGTLDALISSADRCMYQSKEQGRNRVSYHPVPLPAG